MDSSKTDCPQCHSDEISPSGKCLVCGCQIPTHTPVPITGPDEGESRSFPRPIEMDYSEGTQEPSPEEELPQWRKELSQRLREIKQKREVQKAAEAKMERKTPPVSAPAAQPIAPPGTPLARLVERTPPRKSAPRPPIPVPRQKTLQPLEQEPPATPNSLKNIHPEEIQKLIDQAFSRQFPAADARIAKTPGPSPDPIADHEGKLILLSRTLSGLVDLICVVVGTGIFIIAADFFSGIVVLDSISLLNFLVLFLLTYFVYSVFFLASSNQTIGMMITDLRVVGINRKRPSMSQLLSRCFAYLVSLSVLGIGLLWGLFNSESLCFHDQFSDTHVIRI